MSPGSFCQRFLEEPAGADQVVARQRLDAQLQQVARAGLGGALLGRSCWNTSLIMTGWVLPLTTTTSIGRMS